MSLPDAGRLKWSSINANRRELLAGVAASGASLLLPGSACAQAVAGPVLRSGGFPSFRDAVAEWSRRGGTLLVSVDHVETAPVTMRCVPGRAYRLTSDSARTVAYAGPHYHWFFCIQSEGANPFKVDGALTFDGRNNCSIPFFARFENVSGAARRDFRVSGLTVRNARMKRGVSGIDGSKTNAYGATGMLFSGGFDRLYLSHVRALDVTREAGAGLPGSQGCVGIGVTANLSGTQSARHVRIEDFEVRNVNSDDAPGSKERGDMDGVLVFQSPEAGGARPLIQRGTIREAAGRAVKVFAPGGGGTTRDLAVYRSVHGTTGGSNDIAHQHGDGLIENIVFHYSGDAHSQPTVPVGLSSGSERRPGFPFAEGRVRNIRIVDTTGQPKRAVVSVYYNRPDPGPRRYVLENIEDGGLAEYLFMPGSLGLYGPAEILLDDISVHLTTGLFASEDRSRGLRVVASGLDNRSRRAVPFQVFYDGRPAPRGHGGVLIPTGPVAGIIAS